jgi:hypothetical protein
MFGNFAPGIPTTFVFATRPHFCLTFRSLRRHTWLNRDSLGSELPFIPEERRNHSAALCAVRTSVYPYGVRAQV